MAASPSDAVTLEQLAHAVGIEPSRPLPAGYTRLVYIESTGTQYIDTGYEPNDKTRLVLDLHADTPIPECHVFGARPSITGGRAFLVLISANLIWRSDYGSSQVNLNSAPRSGRILIDKDMASCTIGGVSKSNTAQTFTCGHTLYLLAANTGGRPTTYCPAKVYSCRVYDDGALVRDFIPAKRDSDGAVGMCDLASGAFYANSGTGSFVAGPEAASAPDVGGCVSTLEQLSVLSGKIGEGGGDTLLDYIESDGSQYIDTGVRPGDSTAASGEFTLMPTDETGYVFGCRGDGTVAYNRRYGILWDGGRFRNDIALSGFYFSPSPGAGTRVAFTKNRDGAEMNGSPAGSQDGDYGFRSPRTLYLFGCNQSGSSEGVATYLLPVRFHSFEIHEAGTMPGDPPNIDLRLVPVRRADGVVCMRDEVTGAYYENKGAGEFAAGPRKG